jgi:cytochrome c2
MICEKMETLFMKLLVTVPLVAACIGLSAAPAFASGDAAAGEKVFKKCKACHVVDAEKHKTGPHLVNIMGRTAGGAEGYTKYSKALQDSGIVWDEATLDGFLENPKAYVKGTRMAFAGLKKDTDRADVIAYLKSFSQ